MKEITMITTCEVTLIELMSDEDAAYVERDASLKSKIKGVFRDDLQADHVNVLKNKIVIRDLPDQIDVQ